MTELAAAAASRQQFFESDSVDKLMTMVLELTTELWTVRERMFVLERAADRLGVPLSAAIEEYRLSEPEREQLTAMRQRLLTEVLRTVGSEHRKLSGA